MDKGVHPTNLRFITLRVMAGLLLLCFKQFESVSAQEKPNIVLICVDDLKPALGCYGDSLAKTPHLDQLARRGLRFNRAYCNQAVCAPSRNNLLLGSRSTSLGIYGLSQHFRDVVPRAVTLPQYFREHGYETASIGKVFHTGHGNRDDAASWSIPAKPDKVVEYLDPKNSANGKLTREEAFFTNQRLGEINQLPKGSAWEESEVADRDYADGRIAERAIERLQASSMSGKPLFLAVGFVKPHLPLTAPTRYWKLFEQAQFPLAKFQSDPAGAPKYAGKIGGEIVNYEPLTVSNLAEEATQRKLWQGYYACVSYMDAQLGRLITAIDELGMTKKTILVLWGDHGWHLGDHGYWTKHTLYEQANRIPLLIVAPGVTTADTQTDQLAETVDLYPTLAELAGLPPPKGPQPLDGSSLVPVLQDPQERIRDHAYHCYPRGPRMGRAIRTARYRLIEWKEPGKSETAAEYELYDYEADPAETKNLAAEKPTIVQELRAILARHPEAVLKYQGAGR